MGLVGLFLPSSTQSHPLQEYLMDDLIQKSFNTLTMSSREIATLTGKKHYHVVRDIEILAAQLEVDASKFGGNYEFI